MSQSFFVQFTNFFSQSLFVYFASSNFVYNFLSLYILTTSHVIINFSLFQKIINMAKHNCIFNDDWLIEFEWVKKGFYALTLNHAFDISHLERSALTSHSKGKKHKGKEISSTSLPISFFVKKESDVVSLIVWDLDQGQCPSASSHVHLIFRSSVPCLAFF